MRQRFFRGRLFTEGQAIVAARGDRRRHRRIGRAAWLAGAVWLSMAVATVTARQSAPPAQPFRDCPTCPEMVAIPGGTFLMGSPDTEPGRYDTEGPQRRVTIRPFAAGKYDVTRGQWAAFVAATKHETVTGCAFTGRAENGFDPTGSWQDLGFPQDDTHPVVCVTWDDAQAYLRWLSRQTGRRYRLLTEAEWEYAARAGTMTPFPWGTDTTHENANYGADDHFNGLAQGRDRWVNTSPVGAFPANAFGLHDMHGNVLQWVQDCYASYAGLLTDGSAYETAVELKEGAFPWMVGTNSCAYRMLRGGDWGNAPRMIRSAFRNLAPPRNATLERYRSGGVGFRVARSVDTAGVQSNGVEAEILASVHQWAEARVKGDTAFLERFYATELRIGQMNGALIDRDDDIALFAARRIKPEYIHNTDLRVAVYGDTAVVSGIESLKGTYDGRPGEMALRILNVLVRRDGRWQLAASQSALITTPVAKG